MIDYDKFEKSLKHLEAQLQNYRDVDIKPHDKKILFALLAQYLPNTTIWAYGSRVSDNARPWSDLDLVVFSSTEQRYQISLLKEAFEE